MSFAFLLVSPDGSVARRIAADSLTDARAALRPAPGEYVTSSASFSIPLPKALGALTCLGCGQRPRRARCDYCLTCQNRRRNERQTARLARRVGTYGVKHGGSREAKARHDAKPDRRAAKTAWQRQARAVA